MTMNRIVARGTGVAHSHTLDVNEQDIVFRGTDAKGDTLFHSTFSFAEIDYVLLSLDGRLSIQSNWTVVSIPTGGPGSRDQATIETLLEHLRGTVREE